MSRSDARRSSTELSNTGQRVENAQNGGPNDGRLVSPTLSAARPLVAPITLDVPVSTRKESQSKKSAKSARASGDAGDAEDAFFFSASDDEARADHSASTWDARFPEDPAEDPTTKKKSRARAGNGEDAVGAFVGSVGSVRRSRRGDLGGSLPTAATRRVGVDRAEGG